MRRSNITVAQMELFTAVLEQRSFTRAARVLGVPLSTVSRQIAALEAELRVQLLRRSTRSLAPTWSGALFLQRCRRVLSELEEATREFEEVGGAPGGRLRVAAPVELGMHFLGAVTADYLRQHPAVELELVLSERRVELIEEGFDVAIRVGALPDSSLRARKLADIELWCCASPAYLTGAGAPDSPQALGRHQGIMAGPRHNAQPWRFRRQGKSVEVTPQARLHVNNFHLAREAVIAGLGVCVLPAYTLAEPVQRGRLRRLLGEWSLPSIPVHAVHANTQHLPRAVTALLETLSAHLKGP